MGVADPRDAPRTLDTAAALMFKKNATYEITVWVTGPTGGANQSWTGTVVEIDGPLVKFEDGNGDEAIVNTHSIAFIGAKPALS